LAFNNFYFQNSGRDPFPIYLKRRKLPRKFSISQPGNISESDFYKDTDIEVNCLLVIYLFIYVPL